MPNIALFVTYSDVFGKPLTEDELITRIETLSMSDCLQSVGKLSHLLSAGDPDSMREALGLVFRGLRVPGAVMLLDGMLRHGGRVLLWDKQLMAVARLALLHAEDRPPDSFSKQADLWRFVEVLLGVNDVYAHEGDVAEVQDGLQAEEWLASVRLRRVGMPQRIARQSIIRAVRVFIDLPQQHPELVTTVAPTEAFEQRVGMPLERYLAIFFAVMARFSTWDRRPESWLLNQSYWANSSVTDDEFARSVATVSATTVQLRGAFEALIKRGQDSLDDNRPFILHPLIELEPGVYTPVDVEGLADTLIGDGLFWRMRPETKPGEADTGAAERKRSDFGESLGHLLEEHCRSVADSVYPTQPKRLFPEFRYTAGDGTKIDGPDLIVADDRASAFIEIGIGRPHLRNTVIRGDLASYDDDTRRLILHRAKQLDRKIQDAIDGPLVLQGAPADTLRRVHPVICLWDGFPLGQYLYQRIATIVRDAGLLQQPQVAPPKHHQRPEFEQLLGRVKDTPLTDILQRHLRSPLADEPLGDYLHKTFGRDIDLPPLLTAEFDAIAKRLAAQLFPGAK